LTATAGLWLGFNLFVVAMLALDLGVLNRRGDQMTVRKALWWSAFWVALAGIFNLGLWHFRGPADATAFLTGYLIEKSLSVDNLFVILLIFQGFAVPPQHQRKVLFWGIVGALVCRAAFIFAGVALIERFHWMMYVFGAFLVFTGLRMLRGHHGEAEADPKENPVVRWARRLFPVTEKLEGDRLFVRRAGRLWATPLFLALLAVEASDVIFAVDSIPAILAVTRDPFLVYTANAFAILGLRSLFFALAGLLHLFHHLHYGLAAVLVFVGAKLALVDFVKVPTALSLGFIVGAVALSIFASLRWPKKEGGHGLASVALPAEG